MSRKRLIANINLIGKTAVNSYKFTSYLPVGKPLVLLKYLQRWSVDEISISQIDSSIKFNKDYIKFLKSLTSFCNIPISYSGGLSSINIVHRVIDSGFDKLIFNRSFFVNEHLLDESISSYGAQSTCVKIDYYNKGRNRFIYHHWEKTLNNYNLEKIIPAINLIRPGEIYLNDIHRDGSMLGLDTALIRKNMFKDSNVVYMGGVGKPQHLINAFKIRSCEAICVGNYLNAKEHSYVNLKHSLDSDSFRPSPFSIYE